MRLIPRRSTFSIRTALSSKVMTKNLFTLVGSCAALVERSSKLPSFRDIKISTGKEHGAFYRPEPEWLDPLGRWIERK